jgi:hypothetical protein
VKPWPGLVDVEAMPGEGGNGDATDAAADVADVSADADQGESS